VSRLGLGTMTWGQDTGADEATAQLTAFVDAGGTLVDTADVYCEGDSERLLGHLLREVVHRDDLVIATKSAITPDGRYDASRRHLLSSLDASLDRLGVDHVDLWQLHTYDPATPLEETLTAVDEAVRSGRSRYAGVANYAAWQLATATTWQRSWPGRTPIVSAQLEYSLLSRDIEREVVPAALDAGRLPRRHPAPGRVRAPLPGRAEPADRGVGDHGRGGTRRLTAGGRAQLGTGPARCGGSHRGRPYLWTAPGHTPGRGPHLAAGDP
jgi:predicted oxidoreductase